MATIFEYKGGSRDGQIDVGYIAEMHRSLTNNGTIGARFWAATEVAMDLLREYGPNPPVDCSGLTEKYEVVERLEDGGDVWIQVQFIGYPYDDPTPRSTASPE